MKSWNEFGWSYEDAIRIVMPGQEQPRTFDKFANFMKLDPKDI